QINQSGKQKGFVFMKTKNILMANSMNRSPMRRGLLLIQLIVGVAFFWLPQLTHAQCPQICDSNANTALGDGALISNTTGNNNTANGFNALFSNTEGFQNTATGWSALYSNTTGFANTATGVAALQFNTTGSYNTANGYQALYT